MEERKLVACPFCAEPIMPDAVKCKHCGEWLKQKSAPSKNKPQKQCMRCSKLIPMESAKCPECGNNPMSLPVVVQIIIGALLGWLLGWLIIELHLI